MQKFYIGVSPGAHDPALAVVNSEGEILFAEATERLLQNKRAITLTADVREVVYKIIKDYCEPNAEFIIAKSWSKKHYRLMGFINLLGLAKQELIPQCRFKMTHVLLSHSMVTANWFKYSSLIHSGGNIVDILFNHFGNKNISFSYFDHHLTHAAVACYTSIFEESACMVIDGFGEKGSISYFQYKEGHLKEVYPLRSFIAHESLGIFYEICTKFCGFDPEKGEEWKVMGLAPYGKLNETILDEFRSLITVKGLRIKYPSLSKIKAWFQAMKPFIRQKEAAALDAADLAHTSQYFYEEVVSQLLNNFYKKGISQNLAFVGGCALNSSFNGKIISNSGFKHLYIPSAPADDGAALGAALLAFRKDHPNIKPKGKFTTPYLGSVLSKETLKNLVKFSKILKIRHLPKNLQIETAQLLSQEKLIGWIQGRAEFGPRALGNRSILADPRPSDMKERINAKVKFREEFRPFAPSILDEFGEEYFENYQTSPYMERTLTFRENIKEKIPAIVHINRTGRLQSVRREWNAPFYDLIYAFYEITGIPLLLNTSLNIMGKPIIHSVEDAIGIFYTSGLDALVIEDYLIEK